MRRLTRVIVGGAAAVSLLLLVAASVAWVRSHWVADTFWVILRRPQGAGQLRVTTINFGSRCGGLYYVDVTSLYRSPAAEPPSSEWGWDREAGPRYPGRGSDRSWWRRATVNVAGFTYLNGFYRFPQSEDPHPRGSIWVTDFGWAVPFWAVTAVASVLPTVWAVSWRRRRRRAQRSRRGLCPQCGYDVRASTGRCPECGTPLAGTPAPAPTPPPAR